MISLMDHVRKKDLPAELKCRQVQQGILSRSTFCMRFHGIAQDLASHMRTCMLSKAGHDQQSASRSFLHLDFDLRACGASVCLTPN